MRLMKRLLPKNDMILRNLNSINYKTNTLFCNATQSRFYEHTEFKSVI